LLQAGVVDEMELRGVLLQAGIVDETELHGVPSHPPYQPAAVTVDNT